MNLNRVDFPNLKSIFLGEESFCYPQSTIIESCELKKDANSLDLPLLQSIDLGEYALWGLTDVKCLLIMRSNQIDGD